MFYHISDASHPAKFLSIGNLINENGFIHPERCLDSYEFISVTQGVLHLTVDSEDYHISPGAFLFLFPGQHHKSIQPASGAISFYWVHFYLTAPDTLIRSETEPAALLPFYESKDASHPFYILPQTGVLSQNSRVNILFIQLLDLSKRLGSFALWQCSYAVSTLLLELTNECFLTQSLRWHHQSLPANIAAIMEWLQLNYDTTLTVAAIAEKFGYHPAYMTSIFKRATNFTVTEYLNRQRIRVAENLLTATPKLTITQISERVGVHDEKYFMKLFKRYNGLTPTAYRKAFIEKHQNRT